MERRLSELMRRTYPAKGSNEGCNNIAKFFGRSCDNKVLGSDCKDAERQDGVIDHYLDPTDVIKTILDTFLKVERMEKVAAGLESLDSESLEELHNYRDQTELMAEESIPIVEQLMHTKYNEILGLARRVKANFRGSQVFQQLVDKLIDDYVKDPQDSVLQRYKYIKFQKEITVESSKLLDKSCVDLQLIFEEQVRTHLKHPFLIKKMIANDEVLHESYQNKISNIIKNIQDWKRSYNAETDKKMMFIQKTYSIVKAELDKKAESERAKNDYRIRTYEDIESENKALKLDLSRAQRGQKQFFEDLKTTKDNEEGYRQRVIKLSSDLKDLAAKYSELNNYHEQDLLKLDQANQKLAELSQTINGFEAKQLELESDNSDLKEKITKLTQDLKMTQAWADQQKAVKETNEKELESGVLKISELEHSVQDMKKILELKEEQISIANDK